MMTRWSDFGWNDFGRTLADFDELRRRVNSLFEDAEIGRPTLGFVRSATPTWPRANLYDTDEAYLVRAVVPGLEEKDFDINLNRNVLTIAGKRTLTAPEGYSVHRRERGSVEFSRSFTLPGPTDPEKAAASVKNGVLTVTVAKAPEAKPKQIAVENA